MNTEGETNVMVNNSDSAVRSLRDRIIENGIVSVQKNETKPSHIRGCLAGFEVCRSLQTPDDFQRMITEYQEEDEQLHHERVDADTYWEHHCATAQLEFVYRALCYAFGWPNSMLYVSSALAVYKALAPDSPEIAQALETHGFMPSSGSP